MMRHYETIYITNPNLSEEVNKEVIEKFSNLPQKHDGVVVKIEEWGSKRLAYQIKKNDYGFYVLMDYCGGSEITAEIERELKLDDRVLKYQTVKLEDSVDPEALLQKEQEAQAKQAPRETRETREDKSPEASETEVRKIEKNEEKVSDTENSKTETNEIKTSEIEIGKTETNEERTHDTEVNKTKIIETEVSKPEASETETSDTEVRKTEASENEPSEGDK